MARASGQVASVARRGAPAAGTGSSAAARGASGARGPGAGPAAGARLRARLDRPMLAAAALEESSPKLRASRPLHHHQLHWPHLRTVLTVIEAAAAPSTSAPSGL